MITARQQKNIQTARSYFREHLGQGDYYSQGLEVKGIWYGQGASHLGLVPGAPVDEKAYLRLCTNEHPITGEQLTIRQRKVNRRVFCDFTSSAPKSVSLMALTLGDKRLIDAHLQAHQAALDEMEGLVATRVRKNGSKASRTTGNLVAALFTHTSSRALDPQLHTHTVVWNATFDGEERRWKAMETKRIFERMPYLTEVYRNELTRALHTLGYPVRTTRTGIEIDGITEEILARFSKGAAAIRGAVEQFEKLHGQHVTNDGIAAIAHKVRGKKLRHVSAEEILQHQNNQLTPKEAAQLVALRDRAIRIALKADAKEEPSFKSAIARWWNRSKPAPPDSARPAEPNHPSGHSDPRTIAKVSIDYARDLLFERRSVLNQHEVLRAALRHSRGQCTARELKAELASRTEFLWHKDKLTTPEALAIEKQMIHLVNSGIGRFEPLNPRFESALQGYSGIALRTLLNSRDQVLAIDGLAGTGKTTLLKEFEKAVPNLAIFAPTGASVEVLRRSGFASTDTVQGLLNRGGEQLKGAVMVVDEAGMLSNQQMTQLLNLAKAKECRILLVGDHRQHSSVEAGDALRILRRESQLSPVRLRRIYRQKSSEYRKAVKAIALGRVAQGLEHLERLNAIVELPPENRVPRLCEDYIGVINAKEIPLIVAPTWNEIDSVNACLRPQLKAQNLLPPEESAYESHRSLKWTLAEKRDFPNYQLGQVLTFHTPTKDMKRHEWGVVTRIHASGVDIRRMDGKTIRVTAKQAKAFDVQTRKTLPIAMGEKLLLMETRKNQSLSNGKIVTVQSFASDGAIVTTDGITIPKDYRALEYGYATTSYRSQARTVDRVIVSMPPESKIATNLKQFYVSISRGRKGVKIYVADRKLLVEALSRKQVRPSATSLERARAKSNIL